MITVVMQAATTDARGKYFMSDPLPPSSPRGVEVRGTGGAHQVLVAGHLTQSLSLPLYSTVQDYTVHRY